VCKWACRGVGLVSASYAFQFWCTGSGCFDACVVLVWWEECVVRVLLGATWGSCAGDGQDGIGGGDLM
jgi:hypothetical protein